MYGEISPVSQLGQRAHGKHTLFIILESSWAGVNLDSNPLTEMPKQFLSGCQYKGLGHILYLIICFILYFTFTNKNTHWTHEKQICLGPSHIQHWQHLPGAMMVYLRSVLLRRGRRECQVLCCCLTENKASKWHFLYLSLVPLARRAVYFLHSSNLSSPK